MNQKYVNYAIFGAIVLVVVGLAVNHSRHMRWLVDSMASSDPRAQAAAAAELIKKEQFGDSITGESLRTRMKAVDALVALGTPDAVTQLDALLKDQDKPVRDHAEDALVAVAPKSDKHLANLVSGIKEGDANQRTGSVHALQRIGLKDPKQALLIIPAVCKIMKAEAGARSSAGDVLQAFTAQREASVKELLPYLKDSDEAVRAAACDALGKVGSPTAIPSLVEMMKNTPNVRRVSIGAIALIADKSGEPALTEAIDNPNEDNEARAQAATGLGKIATPSAIKTLVKALTDYDLKVQTAAVDALARAGQPAVPDLLAALQAPNPDLRLRAAQALGGIRSASADPGLVRALDDRDPRVRVQAASALGFPGNGGAVDPLVRLLGDRDGDVASAAADALAAIGDPARPALVRALTGPDTVAYMAARALGEQGDSVVADIERETAGAPKAQRWAVVAYGNMAGADAANALEKLAAAGSPEVRASAQEALQRIGVGTKTQ